jgi:hypothetical protein
MRRKLKFGTRVKRGLTKLKGEISRDWDYALHSKDINKYLDIEEKAVKLSYKIAFLTCKQHGPRSKQCHAALKACDQCLARYKRSIRFNLG